MPESHWRPAQTTPLTLRLTGVMSLHNEVYMRGAGNHWHRCFEVETTHPLARCSPLTLLLNIHDGYNFAEGTTVHFAGDLIGLNDGSQSIIIRPDPIFEIGSHCLSHSLSQLNVLEVSSRGRVKEHHVHKAEWTTLVVEHNVYVTHLDRWLLFTAIYVDIGNGVISSFGGVLLGAILNFRGHILEFSDVGHIWAVHCTVWQS
ncbi:uncharacterized protein MELLADRAFT_60404 [Melampsora larici-populina 98AG31]|uniref:Uncharacterized protein n=1 Tax=Melampsora larici-populina (strain 98AG31 / pathotype 3-4-7) TaxID=747676 RepID=F4R9Z9_MELLP|nr:uncharacterized protein MELLADRAFT_60404 [Melampsora larici-populina 98AG31]EGG10623.1 hypothetical protein MELLADRAFT_60404 [Melampsora larici-populina 98AG31]